MVKEINVQVSQKINSQNRKGCCCIIKLKVDFASLRKQEKTSVINSNWPERINIKSSLVPAKGKQNNSVSKNVRVSACLLGMCIKGNKSGYFNNKPLSVTVR